MAVGESRGVLVADDNGRARGAGVDRHDLELGALGLGGVHGVELGVADVEARGGDRGVFIAQNLAAQEALERGLAGAELEADEDIVFARVEPALLIAEAGAKDELKPRDASRELLVADAHARGLGGLADEHRLDQLDHELLVLDRRNGTVEGREAREFLGHTRPDQPSPLVTLLGLELLERVHARLGRHRRKDVRQRQLARVDSDAIDVDENLDALRVGARVDRSLGVEGQDERQDYDPQEDVNHQRT